MTQSVELAEGGKNVQFTDRQVPWMKLGNVIDGALTAKDAAQHGGLDFTVSLRNVYFTCDDALVTTGEGTAHVEGAAVENTAPDCLRNMTNRKVVVRDDTLEPLSIVSSGYPVLQYHEAFDFMDTAVETMGGEGAKYVAAGALKGGKQGFMVVRLPDSLQVNVLNGKDPHTMYAVLRTSMDLTRAVEVMAMPLRGQCMNQLTLTSFAANVPHRWAVRHTSTMKDKLAEAHTSIGKLAAYTARFNEIVTRLAAIKLNEEQARYILTVVHKKSTMKGKDELVTSLIEKWKHSPVVGFAGTGWGLVNAVSEHYDWRPGGTSESKFLNALQGPTHKFINLTAAHLLRQGSK
jgi:phage/plasmid-like protein (TIGR03299 family)